MATESATPAAATDTIIHTKLSKVSMYGSGEDAGDTFAPMVNAALVTATEYADIFYNQASKPAVCAAGSEHQ